MNLNDKFVDYKALNENTKLILGEALAYNKGLAGGYSGDFPLSVAAKDNIYRVPATNKFYVCTENYNGTQLTAPNDKFVELSVWKNHDRLSNLIKKTVITVPWEKFKIVDGGNILQRYLVEAFVEFPFDTNKIISIFPFQGSGFLEYANIFEGSRTLVCGQILSSNYHNSQSGNMKIFIAYI